MRPDRARYRRPLLAPRWLVAHVAVITLVAGFVGLGTWQLDRHEQRRAANQSGMARLAMPAQGLENLLDDDPDTIRYRRVLVRGVFDPTREVLVRSQVHLGTAGFHVVTPLVMADGTAVLVNRGWVPLSMDTPPVREEAAAPLGDVAVEGWVEPSREKPMFGPEDPAEGRLATVSRVDVERIARQVPYPLQPVYLVMVGGGEGSLPAPIAAPRFEDAGPHLGYAVQWFGFATVAAIGYVALARRRLTQPASRARPSTTS